MRFTRWGNAILLTVAFLARAAEPTPPEQGLVEITAQDGQGEVELDGSGSVTATHGVIVTGMGSVLYAQKVHLDQTSGEADAEGNVLIQYEDARGNHELWRGEKVHYDFRNRNVEANVFRLGHTPFFAGGEKLIGESGPGAIQTATNAVITTDDLSDPIYKIKARRITIDANKRITAEHAVLYLGRLPVMYFPHYSRSLESTPNFWTLVPGYRSLYGPFLLSEYHWNIRTNLEFDLDLDYRQRRGPGLGPEIHYDLGDLGKGQGRYYYTRDDSTGLSGSPVPIDSNRYRYDFKHTLTNEDGFAFRGILHGQSDAFVAHDFYERDFRTDPQPKTFAEAEKQWANWSLDTVVQPQINDFFRTVERLPDVKLTGLRQQIGETPVYYESESSLAYLSYRPGALGGTNYSAFRADSWHQILLPYTFFGWLNVTPRAGGRFTHYGELDNVPGLNSDRDRWVFQTGMDVGFKASQTWPGARSELFDADGLRHIVEPTVSYVYTPRPDLTPTQLPQFDQELTSARLLPLVFPDYTQIDSITAQNTIRMGLRNTLQTKREGKVENILNWSAYTDWRLSPNPGQTTFPDLYSDLEFIPRSWIVFTSEVRYDINDRHWRESNHRMTLIPNDIWTWSIGHRYLRDDPTTYGIGNNAIYSSLHVRFNENWGMRTVQQFEARSGVFQEQQYALYRDLRSWTAALVFRLRENQPLPSGPTTSDWTIAVMFSLKAFPRYALGEDRENAMGLFGL